MEAIQSITRLLQSSRSRPRTPPQRLLPLPRHLRHLPPLRPRRNRRARHESRSSVLLVRIEGRTSGRLVSIATIGTITAISAATETRTARQAGRTTSSSTAMADATGVTEVAVASGSTSRSSRRRRSSPTARRRVGSTRRVTAASFGVPGTVTSQSRAMRTSHRNSSGNTACDVATPSSQARDAITADAVRSSICSRSMTRIRRSRLADRISARSPRPTRIASCLSRRDVPRRVGRS